MNGSSTDQLTFYFDPLCPWAWVTSLWARNVRDHGCISINWKFFALGLVNEGEELAFGPLRICALVRAEQGNDAVDRAYKALGGLIHGQGKRVREAQAFEEGATEVMQAAGFDGNIVKRALSDPSTIETVKAETQQAIDDLGAFGVPWLVLNDGEFGFFGPVLNEILDGDKAVDLWEHARWTLQQPFLFEWKRGRASLPPLKGT